MRVGIIGAGLQCGRRAPVIVAQPDSELVAIASLHLDSSQEMASKFGCAALEDWHELVNMDSIDAVLVCTPPHVHKDMSVAAMKAGKHVLCEKPLTKTVEEAEEMARVATETGVTLKCGFNHRHHPALWQAKKIVDAGDIGQPLIGRCAYGICGRPGYEKEWRADPSQAAGGQFIEQGTHAIDLFRWFLGDILEVTCMTGIQYFKEQTLDDNGMAIFRTKSGALASLQASLTQWKNTFLFEIVGEDGYVIVDGLGASYGTEKLVVGKRDFTAPFNDHVTYFRGGDKSWVAEWKEFCDAVEQKREPVGNGRDGVEAMRVALAAYEAETKGQTVSL